MKPLKICLTHNGECTLMETNPFDRNDHRQSVTRKINTIWHHFTDRQNNCYHRQMRSTNRYILSVDFNT